MHNCTASCNTFLPIYEDEASFVYFIFILTGTVSLIACCVVVIFQLYFTSLYPYQIIMQIAFVLGLRSILYISNGLSYLFKYFSVIRRGDIKETGVHCYSFGLDVSCCSVEGTISVFFDLSFLLWNYVWIFDLVMSYKQHTHNTQKIGMVYSIAVYFSAGIICIGLFGLNHNIYGMVNIYI